jgi:7,8-dihydropterin-6-yl-methyl-4-(beta-D-ribofuranosyl)aminobenzene 5'-phosphate synthase
MSKSITITVLVENSVNERDLKAEHGLSFHIETGSVRLLFDTGQSDLVVQNAQRLNIALNNLNAVVLSHGHYDHTGGLRAVLELSPKAKVFHHPAALAPKFVRTSGGKSRALGIRSANLDALHKHKGAKIETHTVTQIVEGIFVTGKIPRETPFENTGGKFFLDEDCLQPDPLLDDQSLFFDTQNGVIVVLGCAHSGIVNTLNYIQELTEGRPIHCLIGGLHLLSANEERVEKTIEAFRRCNVKHLAPGHCTGLSAVAKLWCAFPGCCSSCAVGTAMKFDL